MSVKGKRKKPKGEKKPYKSKTPKKSFKQYAMIGFVLLATIAFIFSSLPAGVFSSASKARTSSPTTSTTSPESTAAPTTATTDPMFTDEGSLSFISAENGTSIRDIKIEVADTDAERARGMMFRKTVPTDTGMLFLMESSKEQSFYMRNTYVSLDILFIDEAFKIVNIAKKAVPRTETQLKSTAPAKYVLEVAAGFTDAYNIKAGDKIEFEIND